MYFLVRSLLSTTKHLQHQFILKTLPKCHKKFSVNRIFLSQQLTYRAFGTMSEGKPKIIFVLGAPGNVICIYRLFYCCNLYILIFHGNSRFWKRNAMLENCGRIWIHTLVSWRFAKVSHSINNSICEILIKLI